MKVWKQKRKKIAFQEQYHIGTGHLVQFFPLFVLPGQILASSIFSVSYLYWITFLADFGMIH